MQIYDLPDSGSFIPHQRHDHSLSYARVTKARLSVSLISVCINCRKDLHPLSKSMNAYIVYEEEKSAVRALKR